MGMSRWLISSFVAALLIRIAVASTLSDEIKNSDCLDCHSDKILFKTNADGLAVSLFVDETRLLASVHKSNTCASCHIDITVKHPDDNVPAKPPNCVTCHEAKPTHEQAARDYAASIHGASHALGASSAAICSDCHGSHEILPVKHADSRVAKLNLPKTCSTCHNNS